MGVHPLSHQRRVPRRRLERRRVFGRPAEGRRLGRRQGHDVIVREIEPQPANRTGTRSIAANVYATPSGETGS